MALINCPECNHQVSDRAATCPNCGFTLNKLNVEPDEQVIRYNEYVYDEGYIHTVANKNIKKFALFAPISVIITYLIITFVNYMFSETVSNTSSQFNSIKFISSAIVSLIMCIIFYSPIKTAIKNKKIFAVVIIPMLIIYLPDIVEKFVNNYFYPRTQVLILCNLLFIVISIVLSYILVCVFTNFILKKDNTIDIGEFAAAKKDWKKVAFIVASIFIILIGSIVIFDVVMDATHKNTSELTEDSKEIQRELEENRRKLEENQRKLDEAISKRDEYYAKH